MPTLPPEVVELIVDEIADDYDDVTDILKSFSLISKDWTSPCQRHLWHLATITLYSASPGSPDNKYTQRMVRRIQSRPHLGSYIRYLEYWTSTPTSGTRAMQHGDLLRIAGVLKTMTGVVEFTFGYGKPYGKGDTNLAFDQGPVSWQEAVLGVMTAPSIETLTLRRISRLPGPRLRIVFPHLTTLTLFKSHCLWVHDSNVFPKENADIFEPDEPTALTCDTRSLKSFRKLWDPPSDGGESSTHSLAPLVDLNLTIDGFFEDQHIPRDLPNLMFLALHVEQPFDAEDLPVGIFLAEVHPAVYTNLIHLEITIRHEEDALPSTFDPLLGLCSSGVLTKLTSLRKIRLNLHFNTVLEDDISDAEVRAQFQSPSWDDLDGILSDSLLKPSLKRIEMRLTLAIASPDTVDEIRSFISWECLRSLRRREYEEGMAFDFKVKSLV